jgi:hypothetical protein
LRNKFIKSTIKNFSVKQIEILLFYLIKDLGFIVHSSIRNKKSLHIFGTIAHLPKKDIETTLAQRINKKIQLIRNSFVRLNAQGAGVGAFFGGPQGAAVATSFVTGSFALLIAKILYDRATLNLDQLVRV